MNKDKVFHEQKREIINKLASINDSDCMSDLADNMLEDLTVFDTFQQAFELMKEANRLAKELAKEENLI